MAGHSATEGSPITPNQVGLCDEDNCNCIIGGGRIGGGKANVWL